MTTVCLTQAERHIIMQVVCEATQVPWPDVQVAALQNLVRIMGLYYHLMEAYMGPALFAVSYHDNRYCWFLLMPITTA